MKFHKIFSICCFLLISFVSSDEAEHLTYEIEVLIYSTLDDETTEKFPLIEAFNFNNEEIITLSKPIKEVNIQAMNDSFKYENKFADIFKNIILLKAEEDRPKKYSKNSGFWYRDIANGSTLASLKRRLLRRSDYAYLGHYTWHQGALDFEKGSYVQLSDDENFDIFIKIYQSRYLHIDLKSYLKNKLKDDELIKYFIDKDIRVFPNEIYYFDHPKFGILVSIKDSI